MLARQRLILSSAIRTNKVAASCLVRNFSTSQRVFGDESGFHDDFKTVRKPPQVNINELMEKKKEEIQKIIESNNIVLFMKGTPQRPECGFSGAVVQVLKLYDVEYHSENMNKDTMMKEALKEYSDWPTIPQLYVNGKFIGGSDIVLNYHKNHEFQDVLDGKL